MGRISEKRHPRREVAQENLNSSSACLYSPVNANKGKGSGGALLSQAQIPGGPHSLLSLCEGTDTASEEQCSCWNHSWNLQQACAPMCPSMDKLQLTSGTGKSISMSTQTEANLLLLSKNCHLKWIPGYKMPTSTVTSTGLSFPDPTPEVTVEAMGRLDTLPASRLTAPSALPHDRPLPGAGPHQGRGAGICLWLGFLAEHTDRQSHVLRVQVWDTCHRLHK